VVEPSEEFDVRILLTETRTEIYQAEEAFRYKIGEELGPDESEEIWLFTYRFDALSAFFPQLKALDAAAAFTLLQSSLKRGKGRDLPEADSIFSLSLSWAAKNSDSYVERDWLQWEQRIQNGFRGFYWDIKKPGCTFSISEISSKDSEFKMVPLRDVSFTSSTAVIIADDGGSGQYLVRVTGSKLDSTRITLTKSSIASGIDSDQQGNLYLEFPWASALAERFVVYDPEARRLDFPSLSPDQDLLRLSVGLDQSIFLCGPSGIFELDAEQSTLLRDPTFQDQCKYIKVINQNRIFLVNRTEQILFFYDGARWAQEHSFFFGDNVNGLGGDSDVAVMIGPNETVLVRNVRTQRWTQLDYIHGTGHSLYAVDGLGSGRFIVVGNKGLIAIREDDAWCKENVGEFITFLGVAVAPDRTYAIAVGVRRPRMGDESTSVIYRIEL
jgi:hypothetical protein